ncbi:alcohol dehydrogenase catalytic domain-containing protein [Nocardioides sp. Leaf374]|uniref:alcohol dehydrogenase catalytic domain-containing protein n=1 Tax=Nocardioides sp. Leaf374 TaxID=2876560 RepID=UPI001E2BA671|nr:alcohol dehydrogenase catalytic domain-containing protein [Nocardioides sp. Leaf374]
MSETMRAMVVKAKSQEFTLEERPVPTPGPGEAVVKVAACGVCHSDMFAREGVYPGVSFPVVPGHEVAGSVHSLGEGVQGWREGQRVGVGWYGGACGWCRPCRMGALIACENTQIPGVQRDGGYADYVLVPAAAMAAMPEELAPELAAPLMCAGVTTYNGLRRTGARPGDLVAVLGVGGLGHLGVQYAAKMGFRVAAIARGTEKADLALGLGAHTYIDSTATDPGEELAKLGGARVVLSTVTNGEAVASTIPGLGVDGELVVVGAAEQPIPVPAAALIPINGSVAGHASGTAADSEDTLNFSALTGVEAQIETMPLEQANEAYARMMAGDARFRMVLTVN